MNIDIPGALHELSSVADRLMALLEWDRLAQEERGTSALPPFHIRDHNRRDIIDLYSAFLNLRETLQRVLEQSAFEYPAEERDLWLRTLREMNDRVSSQEIMQRFIRP